jgi:photosystem II stability/assembly factor-like uncharacterized protein
LGAIVCLALVGFLIGRHDAGDGAQAQPSNYQSGSPSYETEGAQHGGNPRVPPYNPGSEEASKRDVIREAELAGPEEGWALTSSRLAWTADDGRTWRTITPHGLDPGTILTAHFSSPTNGVVAASPDSTAAPAMLEMFATQDGAQNWQRFVVREDGPYTLGRVRLVQSDGVWWALIDEAGDSNAGTRLLQSKNSGLSWQALPRPPLAGQFVFFSPKQGWIIGGVGTQMVWRTIDGGLSWVEVQIPLPATTGPERGVNVRSVSYGLPERDAGGDILLPVTITSPEGATEVVLYSSSDDGSSWSVASSTKLSGTVGAGASEATTTFLAAGELAIQDPGAVGITIVSGGEAGPGIPVSEAGDFSTNDVRAAGLSGIAPLHFVNRTDGVTVVGREVCRQELCPSESQLLFTTDGGRTWTPAVTRP